MEFDTTLSVVQEIQCTEFNKRDIKLFVKRDDLIHKEVSGNKWRKLKLNIELAIQQHQLGVLTFGGAYSNHLLATAAACHALGLQAVGIVRGDELTVESNPILQRCAELGMELNFVSREEYALRNEKAYHEELLLDHPAMLIVPEGGANYYGMIGCQAIMQETTNDFDLVFVAQGTTTTSLGIALSLPEKTKLCVVPVLKGFDAAGEMRKLLVYSGFSHEIMQELLENIQILDAYHFGGYGKYTTELLDFMEQVCRETGLPLDPIYTGKAFYALMDFVKKNDLKNCKILFVHTGGLEGGKSIAKKEGRSFC